jgi:hypothetical protein
MESLREWYVRIVSWDLQGLSWHRCQSQADFLGFKERQASAATADKDNAPHAGHLGDAPRVGAHQSPRQTNAILIDEFPHEPRAIPAVVKPFIDFRLFRFVERSHC